MHLTSNRFDQAWMAIADVMHVITMEIHVTFAGMVFDPDTFSLADGIQARCRNRLMQKVLCIPMKNFSGFDINMCSLPITPSRGTV